MFIELGGVDHHVVVQGEGPPIVFLHALGGQLHAWDGVIAHLPSEHTLVRVDLRGHGRTARGEQPLSVEGWADDVAGLVDRLGLGAVALVGHSLSTLVAQHLAVTRPGAVDRLVLVGALAGPADAGAIGDRAAQIERDGLDAMADAWLERALAAATRRRLPQLAGLARALLLANDPAAYAEAMRALGTAPPIEHGDIRQPTLVLVGEEDRGTTPEHTRELADAIPGARHHVVPGGAHWVMLDQPAEVAHQIAAHLDVRW